MKIDRHISDLLYDHDCVIVPEMGGFLGSYSPASIHPVRHTFSPPSKKIAFNVFLKHNDGLLANYLVQRENLSYNEALKEIKDYVSQYYHELEAGQKFMVENVGVLYMDSERHIQFDPIKNANYLRNSFGFSAIQCLPVSNEPATEKRESTFSETRQGRSVKTRPSVRVAPKTISKTKKGNMVNAMLLVGAVMWFALNVYFVSPSKISFASLNPFADTVLHREPVKMTPTVVTPTKPTPAPVETVIEKPSSPAPEKETPTPATSNNSTPTSSAENIESKKSNANFFLIGGAFRSVANATKLADELKTQGYAEVTIVESENGFKLVCYKSFSNRQEALAALNQLKEEKKEGWIYSSR